MSAQREQAFHAFFETHYAGLTRLAYLVTGKPEVADDLTADALLEVWRHWDRVAAADSPIGYARGVLVNLARNRLRREGRERRGLLALLPLWTDQTYAREVDVPAAVDVDGALRRLPYRRRACVVLRHVFDLSEQETARTLGISVGTVKSQTSRGVTQLAGLLGMSRKADQSGAPSSATGRTDSLAPVARVVTPPGRPGTEV
ncbi:SigE family RNA polymerase sigma factor [Actinoplanes oblitus]|uniref:SigE family RNA polymerase sigma factor n=1 Tax=Actinoplanes oblitus TaxID=3040509 RepID=A0ABY8WGK3_9ACTN|nr:SigE family RNA polymerase sigma factor [Actinoplanes oblitus]WIM96994.1 SigE family RNA polymerase sigma factor [Actinoplanes oblitus]